MIMFIDKTIFYRYLFSNTINEKSVSNEEEFVIFNKRKIFFGTKNKKDVFFLFPIQIHP